MLATATVAARACALATIEQGITTASLLVNSFKHTMAAKHTAAANHSVAANHTKAAEHTVVTSDAVADTVAATNDAVITDCIAAAMLMAKEVYRYSVTYAEATKKARDYHFTSLVEKAPTLVEKMLVK
jgi:hypothetical protein